MNTPPNATPPAQPSLTIVLHVAERSDALSAEQLAHLIRQFTAAARARWICVEMGAAHVHAVPIDSVEQLLATAVCVSRSMEIERTRDVVLAHARRAEKRGDQAALDLADAIDAELRARRDLIREAAPNIR